MLAVGGVDCNRKEEGMKGVGTKRKKEGERRLKSPNPYSSERYLFLILTRQQTGFVLKTLI